MSDDSLNQALLRHVQPPDWVNPQPLGRYQLVVIGAGAAGLVTAIGANGLGAKVAIVERNRMGGDCLNYGCVPSKALLHSAQVAAMARRAVEFGVHVGDVTVDFPAVMARLNRLRLELAPHDSVGRLRDLGIYVFLGEARFIAADKLRVDSPGSPPGSRTCVEFQFGRAVIATGTRPAVPPIPGLAEVGFLTNETVFSLQDLPPSLVVIGGGPIGCELAQAFARLGSKVTLLQSAPRLLPRDDPLAAEVVLQALQRDGVRVHTDCQVTHVARHPDGLKRISFNSAEGIGECQAEAILVAVGRQPNVDDLGLESAGVTYRAQNGIQVSDTLYTTNPRILAVGDVASAFRFTHAAEAHAKIAVQNALLPIHAKASRLVIPWCTYTDPELAHVGLTAEDAARNGIAVDTLTHPFSSNDRAVLCGQSEGFVKVHLYRGTDRIAGATIVGPHAGDLISEITLLMTARLGLAQLAKTIHPYPTHADASRKVADAWNRTRLTPFVARLLQTWINWRL